jgi:uncharacterized protein
MRGLWMALAALFLLTGCSPGQDSAQTGLPTADIVIDTPAGPHTFHVEMATNDEARRKGLMFRSELGADNGMLFDFGREGFRSFWMKNTPLPLDMIFIKADGTISNIIENTIPYSEEPDSSSEPVQAVLEIGGGRARALGIEPGARVHAAVFANR